MKYCTKCKANVNTQKKQCPVCFDELEISENTSLPPSIYSSAKPTNNLAVKNFFLTRLFFFLTISISSICFFINYMFTPTIFWSLAVLISILYVWILVRHTIISRRGAFEKTLFQFFGILGIIMATNYVSGGNDWFWPYVVPSASLATTTVLMLVLFVNQKRADFLLSFFLMSLVLIITSVILLFTGADSFRLLSLINLLYTGLFALGIIIFGFKTLKKAFHKTLHI